MKRSNVLQSAVAVALALGSSSTIAAPPSSSAYFTDPQSSHVEDATSRGIGTVNMIACIMSAMKPADLVNDGNYIALVDENKCDSNNRSSSASSGGSQGASYMTAVVNSSRASNNDPMLVKTWISEEEEGNAMTIFVRTSASEAPTSSNPYGVFRLDFCGKPDAGGSCMFKGFLDAQAGSLNFYQEEGGGGYSSTTALRLTSVGTSTGSGKLSMTESQQGGGSQSQEFAFAYDQSYFLRGDQCFSRDASDPDTRFSVWRYGLYDTTTGARVTRNSGFPIEYTSGGSTYHGYMGFWGLHTQPGAPVPGNGSTVNRVEYNSNGGEPTTTAYTLVKSEGKLTKYTRRSTTLDKLDKIRLNTWVGQNASEFFTGATANAQYELYWDNAAGNFKVTGQMNCGENGCQTQSLSPEPVVSVSFFASQGGLQGWSQSLGGEVFVRLAGVSSPVDSTTVVVNYRVQDLVYPNDMPATLYCVNNCPTAATMSAYFADGSTAQSPFTDATYNNFNQTSASNVVTYASDANGAVLKDNTAAAVTFVNAAALQSRPQYQHGIRTGRLFTSLAAAECSAGSGTYCDYKVNDADVYYQWETGANQWNQFAAVKDASNNVVAFEAPLQVNYVVPSGAQYGDYAGKTIVLQYGGFGDLWGIPGSCVSRLTNQPMSCDNQDARYVPEFVIPMSETTGVVTSGNTSYLVKWLDREIRFARKSLATCGSLAAPTNVTLPTAAGLQDPSDANSTAYIGTKPTVTGAPRVIHGDVKY